MSVRFATRWLAGSLLIAGTIVSATLVSALLVSGLMFSSYAYAEDEAAAWLEKMAEALRVQNYDGTFTYIRGSRYDTVRIVHRADEGSERERLFNMNGEVLELYREDDEVYCYHPELDAGDEDLSDHSVHIGPFTPAFPERVLSARNLYRLALQGEDRIAGRSAVMLLVIPGNSDRYGYKIWLDQETGLMLQSHLIDRGRVKEIFQFTHIEVGSDSVDVSELETAIAGNTFSHPLTLEANDATGKPVWQVSWLPDGFRAVRAQGNRLHFTDGLATFSVFIETAGSSDLPDMVTTVGGTVVISRRIPNSGPQITVVGEVPLPTARRVAESVQPVIY